MAETVDDLTVRYEENGEIKVQETAKAVLTKGTWATIMFRYRELDAEGNYGPEKVTIRRYQKRGGAYRMQSKFNISGEKQARQVAEVLLGWYPPE